MQRVLTADVQYRIERSVAQFPELTGTQITVGLTRSADGTAEAENMIIRLNVRQRKSVSYFTIGHELTHLLQSGGLRLVPSGEIPCDVWALARSELFLDDRPSYLCSHLWTRLCVVICGRDRTGLITHKPSGAFACRRSSCETPTGVIWSG